jgi:hypothetical protein
VKGEIDNVLRRLELASLTTLRPRPLGGDRTESRFGERLALPAARPLRTLIPRQLRSVSDIDVAATMVLAARAAFPPAIVAAVDMHGAAGRIDAHPPANR